MLTKLDQAILAVEHDRDYTSRGMVGRDYSDLFDYIGAGVSRRAYLSIEDGLVYKVGEISVNYDEYLANKWFNANLPEELRSHVAFPTIDCFRFNSIGMSVNVMPFVDHHPVMEVTTIRQLKEAGQYAYCYIHNNVDLHATCDCPRNIAPTWWSEVTNYFSTMGCMDFDIGRNAFIPDGEHIVPIDLGYWGLCAGWARQSNLPPWAK